MPKQSILLADANIIIDFLKADTEALGIICENLDINIASVIIQDEITQLSIEDAKQLGLKIAEPEVVQLIEANTSAGRVSFYDMICLILSRDNEWTCISNDKKLHTECDSQNVDIIWGLELILHSVEQEYLSKERAIICFSRIQAINTRMNKKVEEEFLEKLNKI